MRLLRAIVRIMDELTYVWVPGVGVMTRSEYLRRIRERTGREREHGEG